MELWDLLDCQGNKTGRTVLRGQPMSQDEYHLVVHVWVVNSRGEYLISRRTSNKTFPGMWEASGGSALAGEDSLTAAIREVREELGVALAPKNGFRFRRYRRQHHDFPDFVDVWLFTQDVSLSEIVYQAGETDGAMLATKDQINKMIDEGVFVGRDIFFYMDELFASERKGSTQGGLA